MGPASAKWAQTPRVVKNVAPGWYLNSLVDGCLLPKILEVLEFHRSWPWTLNLGLTWADWPPGNTQTDLVGVNLPVILNANSQFQHCRIWTDQNDWTVAIWRFPARHRGTPIAGWFMRENPTFKWWMMTRATAILENHHPYLSPCVETASHLHTLGFPIKKMTSFYSGFLPLPCSVACRLTASLPHCSTSSPGLRHWPGGSRHLLSHLAQWTGSESTIIPHQHMGFSENRAPLNRSIIEFSPFSIAAIYIYICMYVYIYIYIYIVGGCWGMLAHSQTQPHGSESFFRNLSWNAACCQIPRRTIHFCFTVVPQARHNCYGSK